MYLSTLRKGSNSKWLRYCVGLICSLSLVHVTTLRPAQALDIGFVSVDRFPGLNADYRSPTSNKLNSSVKTIISRLRIPYFVRVVDPVRVGFHWRLWPVDSACASSLAVRIRVERCRARKVNGTRTETWNQSLSARRNESLVRRVFALLGRMWSSSGALSVRLCPAFDATDWPNSKRSIDQSTLFLLTSKSFFSRATRVFELSDSDKHKSRCKSSRRFWWLSSFMWRRLMKTSMRFNRLWRFVSFGGTWRCLRREREDMIECEKKFTRTYFLHVSFSCDRSSSSSLSDMSDSRQCVPSFVLSVTDRHPTN